MFRASDRLGVEVALKRLVLFEDAARSAAGAHPLSAPGATTETATERSGAVAVGLVPASTLARPMGATLGLALAREFRALRSLRHPNVVEVLDYGFDAGRWPFFTMQLLEGAVPITVAARGAPFETKVHLIGQLLRAVRYIHGRGILHRDLSAKNVLVERGTVKVLDFGLAVQREDRDPRLARWGTRGYFAPELAHGAPASTRSDLFAVGVLALETFLEQRALDAAEVECALEAVDPRVQPLLAELTRQDLRARPNDAGEVLVRLASATGVAFPLDTPATIESALTTANLVGRERELARLDAALAELAVERRGSAWRLEGESGIGKSRLMDELRTRALVAGCRVLEGQAIQEGGAPYEVLAGVVRGLALEIDVTAEEALALLPVIDVTEVAGVSSEDAARASADGGASDPEIVRTRLFAAIEALLRRIDSRERSDLATETTRPTVLLFEDVQWSAEVALGLVARIAALAATTPLLVVASHRDGAAPAIARELSSFRVLRVERLEEDEARSLVRSAIGNAPPELLTRLARESEGHPFFLVELLRWTAEHGAAAAVSGKHGLPDRIEAIVRTRLLDLAAPDRVLFQIAAVVGREVDPELLVAIAGVESSVVETWVRAGFGAGLLETRGDRARFAHDKLREGVLVTTSPDERRRWHLRAGEEIERRARDPIAQSATLAHHYASGGDDVRAARWEVIAGERALASGANAEAIRLLGQALRASRPDDDRVGRARLARLMGAAHLRIGDYPAAHERGVSALRELGRSPRATRVRVGQMLKDAALLVARARRPSGRRASPALDEAMLGYFHVAETAFVRDAPLDLGWGLLRALALVDGGPTTTQVTIYGAAGLVAGTMRLDRVAQAWSGRAIALAEELGSPALLASALHRRGVCAVVSAEWKLASGLLARARETAERGEDRRQWQETTTVLGLSSAYRGDLTRAAALLTEVHESAKTHGDRQGVLWGGPMAALCHLRLGEAARAATLLEEAGARVDETTTVYDRVNFHGPRSLHLLRAGDPDAACREATLVIDMLQRTRLSAYWTFHGLDAALETLFTMLEGKVAPSVRRGLVRDIARGCAEARRLARFCAFAKPSALLWEGQRLAVAGDVRRARARWTKAEALAYQYELTGVAGAARRLCVV